MWNVNVGAKALHVISYTRLTITVLRSILNRSSRCRPENVAEYRRAVSGIFEVLLAAVYKSPNRTWCDIDITELLRFRKKCILAGRVN
jgi:hypothetical protein